MESVLIIDDDIDLCTVLSEELNEVGYTTAFLTDGYGVVDYVLAHDVDIILLDINMPGKNGFEVLKELSEAQINIPVIVLTAYADVQGAIQSAKLGACDFLNKPYDFDELLITLRRALQRV